jgi:chaperonin GroEL (HSP60 family)
MSTETEEKKELKSFDELWENFSQRLSDARVALINKKEEIEKQTEISTRIDLTEHHDLQIMVHKLEAALETLNLVRVECMGLESLINYEA